MGVKIGGDAWKKCQEHSFVSDNACEAITENWSKKLDEPYSIRKRKWIEKTHKKYSGLLQK